MKTRQIVRRQKQQNFRVFLLRAEKSSWGRGLGKSFFTLLLKIFRRKAISVTKRNLLGTIVKSCSSVFGTVITLSSLNSSEISTRNAFFFRLISTKVFNAEEKKKIRSVRKNSFTVHLSSAWRREEHVGNLFLRPAVFEWFR